MIEISLKRFRDLMNCEEKLLALEAMGVDNWQGYEDAMREMIEARDEDDTVR